MNGYGSRTYSFINARNERFWVKFHFQASQGSRCMTYEGSAKIIYRDRESQQQKLFYTFEKEDFPKWWTFNVPTEDPQHTEPPLKVTRDADWYDHHQGDDAYIQAGNLYRLLPIVKNERLHKAITSAMSGI